MNLDRILEVDGSYMIHRALHVSSIYQLTNSRGEGTGGVFQFFRSLFSEMRNYPGYFPIICWDNGLADRRVALYPNYKCHEDRLLESAELKRLGAEPEEDEYLIQYHAQREKVMEILGYLGVPSLIFKHWEGDDLLYILSRMFKDTIVLTDDRDLIQLLSPNTRVARPMAGEVLEYYSYQEEHRDPDMKKFVITKSICGDGSDNIPSCAKGVGGVTADIISDLIINNPDNWHELVESHSNRRVRLFGNSDAYNQLDINLQLIDLNYVDITDEIVRDISNTINAQMKLPNYFKAMIAFNTLEVQDFDLNGMIANLTSMITERENS